MMNMKLSIVALTTILLNACSWNSPDSPTREMVYPIDNPYQNSEMMYREPAPLPKFVKTAEVPQTQVSAKNLDSEWVRKQNPQDYTIMIASNDQPLGISKALMEVPKNQRSAAIKYSRNGKTFYTGVYGNYMDANMAKENLENLPSDVKQEASVVQWSQVQRLYDL
jgi:septal ring-binding cell division protein DamX